LIIPSAENPVTIDEMARELLAREASIGPSPVRGIIDVMRGTIHHEGAKT
jgi:hypothetical protein